MPAYECLSSVPSTINKDSLIMAHFENGRVKTFSCIRSQDTLLSSIYVARVDSIAPQIHAVFVKISPDITCYLPDNEIPDAIFTHKPSKKAIAIGDELLVQIVRLPIKTKLACVSTRLTITGHYVVVTSKSPSLGISKKIGRTRQEELRSFLSDHSEEYFKMDMVARTNCAEASFNDIHKEACTLSFQMHQILETAGTRTLYECLYRNRTSYVRYIDGCYPGEISQILTDDASIYEEVTEHFRNTPTVDSPTVRYYTDSYPLYQLYSLKKELTDALKPHVWLKSGAYLIIEQTEALTVIDVNSGKKENGKKESYFYDVNIEAANEIAHQLILRNISGICIIDFIDLQKDEDTQNLLQYMRKLCKKDHITTSVVDITKLHLMELTRKKTGPTLFQQIMEDIT
jgi:ribonuclease G